MTDKEFDIGDEVIIYTDEKGFFIGEVYEHDYRPSPLHTNGWDYLVEIEDDEYGYVGTNTGRIQSRKCDCGRDKLYLDKEEKWGCTECD